ncbi:mitochondrial conserved fungal membrane protein [Schizosaccharomyces osmophilus]|uniref:Mitochondrial conserved fungal membrane protein n=1 Tax=Schizosaccharomyces osmophilus TaxID=2545709 RepID=A0AAE9WDM7_9SCHI|nr:mitochondrial conserved fungal membrane protein [Schizosaccharomyces osmophilus]WBW74280.1 mitochondrial conserved fungal membrane protein [Schizosaccharomyces osmophilus]
MAVLRSLMSNRYVRWTKQYPELFITWCVMTYTFGVAGYMLGQRGMLIEHDTQVRIPREKAHPWEDSDQDHGSNLLYGYKYFPRGDTSKEPKKSPSPIQYSTVTTRGISQNLIERFSK